MAEGHIDNLLGTSKKPKSPLVAYLLKMCLFGQ